MFVATGLGWPATRGGGGSLPRGRRKCPDAALVRSAGVMATSASVQSRFPTEPHEKRAALLAAVDGMREIVEAHADEAEARGTLSRPVVDALISTGLLSLKLPAALGGIEADPRTQIAVIEAMSAIDPSTG